MFLAVYVPAAGHGFISDDFVWIFPNRIRQLDDIWRIVHNDNGFYRPAVALSFAANEFLFGLNARAYGLTNVALAVVCGAALYALCRSLKLPSGAGAFAAALWLLNLHGINMAVLWISGRTALIATAALTGCLAALLRGRQALAIGLLAIAVFAREEVSLFPLAAAVWLSVLGLPEGRSGSRLAVRWFVVSGIVVVLYFVVRSTTEAMTPWNAPAFYQFTTTPHQWFRNAAEYADRTMTVSLGVLLLGAAILRPRSFALDRGTTRIVICGVVWLVLFLLPAYVLPVRSSLYACLPSVGVCVAAAAIAANWWSLAAPGRRQRALVCVVLVSLVMWPVYRGRTHRWVQMAEFSTQALSEMQTAVRNLPDDSDILIIDDRSARANIASVFSAMLRDSFLLVSGRYMTFYVDPPIPGADAASGGAPVCGNCIDVTLAVENQRLVRR